MHIVVILHTKNGDVVYRYPLNLIDKGLMHFETLAKEGRSAKMYTVEGVTTISVGDIVSICGFPDLAVVKSVEDDFATLDREIQGKSVWRIRYLHTIGKVK